MKLTDQICVINSDKENGLAYVTYYEAEDILENISLGTFILEVSK